MSTLACLADVYYDGIDLVWARDMGPAIIKGSYCGNISRGGYKRFYHAGKRLSNHIVIWNIVNGEIPKGMEIDHINHDRSENRIENLRLVSRQENAKNKGIYKSNTSGFSGVTIEKNGKFKARISVSGKRVALGTYIDFNDACNAIMKARLKYKFHENHGG
ncbi:HNH endonuclease [Escherichia phage Phagiculus]